MILRVLRWLVGSFVGFPSTCVFLVFVPWLDQQVGFGGDPRGVASPSVWAAPAVPGTTPWHPVSLLQRPPHPSSPALFGWTSLPSPPLGRDIHMNCQELPARGPPLSRPLVCAVVCYPVWAPGCQPWLWAAARYHPTAPAAGPSGFTPGAVRAHPAPVQPRARRGRS